MSAARPWAVTRRLAALPERGLELLGVLNGCIGDRLAREGSSLAVDMRFVCDGRVLDLERPLGEQLEGSGSRLAVFVHGLMCTESIWSFPFGRGRCMGERLEEELGVRAVYVRYNSGRHISQNGRELSAALEQLCEAWPEPVDELNLIGYSMGGLVARSAIVYGERGRRSWLGALARVFLIAAPLRGSRLEQLAQVAQLVLGALPSYVTRLIARGFRQRSDGVKDLRSGFLIDEEWLQRDPDGFTFGRRFDVPSRAGVDHYVIAGTLAPDEGHPLSQLLGDALVTPASAKGAGFAKDARVFPGLGHLALVNDERVYAAVREWLIAPRETASQS